MKTTAKERAEVIARLTKLGLEYQDAERLRRCAMALHSWNERECGDGNDYASWSIERDETTGKPYLCTYPHQGKSYRRPIADREAGALKRIKGTLRAYPELVWYHQGDCRGASLYILRKDDLGEFPVEQVYTRGVAVY
jgi:hypothetical protein